MKKEFGIWLDTDKAYIMNINNDESFTVIESNVEHFHIHGGSGSSTPYGPQDSVSESTLLERKKHQLNDYFNRVMDCLNGASAIAIFGPAEAKTGLAKELENHPELKGKIIAVKPADSMTENQIKALFIDFYGRIK